MADPTDPLALSQVATSSSPSHVPATRGATIPLWSWSSEAETEAALKDLQRSGATAAIIDFHLLTEGLSGSTVTWEDDLERPRLEYAVRTAGELGLDVWIKPIVIIGGDDPANRLYWQNLAPEDPSRWFSEYEDRLLEALALDDGQHVSTVLVTNELRTLTNGAEYTSGWLELLATLRNTRDLELGFNAGGLLDEPEGEHEYQLVPSPLYDAVDFIGISAYPRMDEQDRDGFAAAWRNDLNGQDQVAQIQAIAATVGKPVYFTELGVAATVGGNRWYADPSLAFDDDYPTAFFDGAIEVLAQSLSNEVDGVFVYSWGLSEDLPPDADLWNVNTKPAKATLSEWWLLGRDVETHRFGTPYADEVRGSAFDDLLEPGLGGDSVLAGAGDDVVVLPMPTEDAVAPDTATIGLEVSSDILDGVAAEIAILINGSEAARFQLEAEEAGRNPDFGDLPFTTVQRFEAVVDLVDDVESVWIVHLNDDYRGFGLDRNATIWRVDVDGDAVDLRTAAYHPVFSPPVPGGTVMFDGGSLRLDASGPEAARLSRASATNDNAVFGGDGDDTVMYAGSRGDYVIDDGDGSAVTVTGPQGDVDLLVDVERIEFLDVALSLVDDRPNAPPTPDDDAFRTLRTSAMEIAAEALLANDGDPDGDVLHVSAVEDGEHGTVTLTEDGRIIYAPRRDFIGLDAFRYHVSDGRGESVAAMATVAVDAANAAPVAADDDAETDEDEPVVIELLDGDEDPDGDPLSIVWIEDPANGDVSSSTDGRVVYTPAPDFHGEDTFEYEIEDGFGGTDRGTVRVLVNARNDPPEAQDDSIVLGEGETVWGDLFANDRDPDFDPLDVVSVDGEPVVFDAPIVGRWGVLMIGRDGAFSYAAGRSKTLFAGDHASESFRYVVGDGAETDEAELSVTVSGRGDPFVGGSGNDVIVGGRGADRIDGRGGNDRLNGRGGDDVVNGAAGDDRIVGGGGDDQLNGGGGRDRILGGSGGDLIVGGKGNDEMSGGGGPDVFRLKQGDGRRDVITDFGGRDKIEITKGAKRFKDLKILDRGDDVHVLYKNGKVVLENVEPREIKANDFLL